MSVLTPRVIVTYRWKMSKKSQRAEVVELDENQKLILSKLQGDLDVTAEPFAFLCSDGLEGGRCCEDYNRAN